LRAALSLARSWHQQGERDAAHRLVSEISGQFSEGLDSKDLRAARALLSDSATVRSV